MDFCPEWNIWKLSTAVGKLREKLFNRDDIICTINDDPEESLKFAKSFQKTWNLSNLEFIFDNVNKCSLAYFGFNV